MRAGPVTGGGPYSSLAYRIGPRTAAPRRRPGSGVSAPHPSLTQRVREGRLGPGSYSFLPRPSSTSGSASGVKNGHSQSWNRQGPAFAWMNSACWHQAHGLVLLGSRSFQRTADRLGFVTGTPIGRVCYRGIGHTGQSLSRPKDLFAWVIGRRCDDAGFYPPSAGTSGNEGNPPVGHGQPWR